MTIKWGDPIECNGVRPDWLRGRQPLSVDTGLGCGWMYEDVTDYAAGGPVEEWSWSHSDGKPCILRFKLPADHPAYVALARGFHPWSGGESAPGDWDGGECLARNGSLLQPASWKHPWFDGEGHNNPYDVIGYRKRVEYGAVHTDGSRSGGQPSSHATFVPVARMTEAEARDWIMNHTYTESTAHILHALEQLGLVESLAERFTRETGHAVTEAVESALNWKGE